MAGRDARSRFESWELFNVELPDLLVSSWKKARELQEALEESRKSPDEVIVLDLAEHEITNEYIHTSRYELLDCRYLRKSSLKCKL